MPQDIKALKMSVPGVIGKSGEMCLIAGNKENLLKYLGNLVQWAKTCDEAYIKLTNIKNQLHIDSSAFAEIYMGCGDFLYPQKFERTVSDRDKNISPFQIYYHYMSILWRLLEF